MVIRVEVRRLSGLAVSKEDEVLKPPRLATKYLESGLQSKCRRVTSLIPRLSHRMPAEDGCKAAK